SVGGDVETCESDNISSLLSGWIIFFFQAEDGIRDWSVTGVQTCALPIYLGIHHNHRPGASPNHRIDRGLDAECRRGASDVQIERSEERRVGKECRSRWSPYH